MEFIGRKIELKKIQKEIDSQFLSVCLIYGRRRVGKSELVKQIIKKNSKTSIYYECKQVAQASNARALCTSISETLNLPLLGYTQMEEVLEYLFKISMNQEMILVLDEYPYLKEDIRGIDSILQALIDRYKDTSKLKLILLGSYINVMKTLVEYSNPLYGRSTLVIDLKQMDYYESSLFYPSFSLEDKVALYSVFGGIPYYNRLIDESMSLKDNIINLIASSGARLENEISMHLASELKKVKNYNEVFEALARGNTKFKDLEVYSNVSSSATLTDVLRKLIEMEVVIKKSPINDKKNKKKSGYYISDNLSKFYYRYIFRYASQLQVMNEDVFYEKYIKEDFEKQFIPKVFEDICIKYLVDRNRRGLVDPMFLDIGKYYYDDPVNHRNGEFDIVTQDEQGYVFYEVKYMKEKVTQKIIDKELNQVKQSGLNPYKCCFISKSGFSDEVKNKDNYLVLEDIYNRN